MDTLPEKAFVGEGSMKHNWTVRRATVARADAPRWDQAYVHLLRWAETKQTTMKEEVPDARCDLRSGFDPPPSAGEQH